MTPGSVSILLPEYYPAISLLIVPVGIGKGIGKGYLKRVEGLTLQMAL